MSKKQEISDLEVKIEKLKKSINSGVLSADEQEMMKPALKSAEEKLERLKSEADTEGGDEPKAKVEKPKKTTTAKAPRTPKAKSTEPKAPRTPKAPKSPSKFTIDGKEYEDGSAEFCEALIESFKKRREKAKSTGRKTKSVMESVTDKIGSGISQVIANNVSANKEDFNKNPDKYIKKFEALENKTKDFLVSLKELMGEDYNAVEITNTVKEIEALIEKLKKQAESKKK